jgi:hypothetical protein
MGGGCAACRRTWQWGLSAAEAARAALAEELERRPNLTQGAEALAHALDEMNEPAAQAVLDRLLADFTVETVLRDVLMPYLHELDERWARGTASVARAHFASHLLRERLSGLGRGWGEGRGHYSPALPATSTTCHCWPSRRKIVRPDGRRNGL